LESLYFRGESWQVDSPPKLKITLGNHKIQAVREFKKKQLL
jgi:hypothetical protein